MMRVRSMLDAQHHRGPDGDGAFAAIVGEHVVALGHVRLAILDLTRAGAQPMALPDRSGVLIFNGEIYNYRELRRELETEGASFRTETDTEVLLQALHLWGNNALPKLNGMWAFAWLDLKRRTLTLSRDRFGVKPLYYCHEHGQFLFASEIKALLSASDHRFEINAKVAGRFLEQGLLDAQTQTFFSGIESVPAGHTMTVRLSDGKKTLEPEVAAHWRAPSGDEFVGSESDRIEALRESFFDAVRIRLRSDVPVGVLLSGGIDSSAIAAAMRQVLGPDADLHLLSAISGNPDYDETPHMERMAHHLRSPLVPIHIERTPEECFHLLGLVTRYNDEPIGSFSTVAHFLLMECAKERGITVILSGQGADELLCGYRKFLGFRLQELALTMHPVEAVRTLWSFIRNRTVVNQFELTEARRYLPGWIRPSIDIRGSRLKDIASTIETGLGNRTLIERQWEDVAHLSVPALVHYEDRCSMAWSREIRLPFLDYRIVGSLIPADPAFKLRDGWTKWILRKAMEPFVPPEIIWRRDKQPFINPQADWLRNELRPTVTTMLSSEMLTARAGLVNQNALRRRYHAYCRANPLAPVSFKEMFHPIALELWAREFESRIAI